MVPAESHSKPTAVKATLIGTAIGASVMFLSLVAGLLVESWNVGEFLSNLTLEAVGSLVLLGGMTIATVAIPIALYLYFRIVSPLALLGVVVIGWLAIGIGSGVIEAGAIFGLGLYAVGLSPFYVVLYLILGVGEFYVRTQDIR